LAKLPTAACVTVASVAAGEVQELLDLVAADVAEDAAVAGARVEEPRRAATPCSRRCGPRPSTWTTRPIAPLATIGRRRASRHSHVKPLAEIDHVSCGQCLATVRRASASWSRVVNGVLSVK
jgi:hypothetical protein